jgi:hypothetical protein
MEDRVTLGSVVHRIAEVRGVRVMLDEDLARMLGVGTAVLNQAVHRNAKRFPEEFVFRLSAAELSNLRSQSVISSWGGRRYPPLAFTEHGVLMAATVLRSEQAIEMSVFIVRAFVRLRSIYASHIELTRRLDELDVKVSKQDAELRAIVQAIRQLALPPVPRRHLIGFTSADSRSTGVVP